MNDGHGYCCTNSNIMMCRVLVVLACVLSVAWGFSLPRITRSSGLRMMAEGDAPAEVKWEGAKKFSMKDREKPVIMTSEQISKILPHRYPFLLVDRVVEFIPGKSAVGIKCITSNEPQVLDSLQVATYVMILRQFCVSHHSSCIRALVMYLFVVVC